MGADHAAAADNTMTTKRRPCELCGGSAAVHCAADSAFLCLRCDARVHGANFLASRHRRRRLLLAPNEQSTTSSGSSSSSCVSTADSAESTAAAAPAPAQPRASCGSSRGRRKRAEAVLEGWAKRTGLAPGAARRRASAAADALRTLGRGVAAARVPIRVAMAGALWLEISSGGRKPNEGGGGGHDATLLLRLEATAHVPARLMLTVASWMARQSFSSAEDDEEGWAECSCS